VTRDFVREEARERAGNGWIRNGRTSRQTETPEEGRGERSERSNEIDAAEHNDLLRPGKNFNLCKATWEVNIPRGKRG